MRARSADRALIVPSLGPCAYEASASSSGGAVAVSEITP